MCIISHTLQLKIVACPRPPAFTSSLTFESVACSPAGNISVTFDPALPYVGSLLYLAAFGSVVAFACYFALLGRIGAERSAYATVLFPIVALTISTLFEGYHWSAAALAGVLLIVAGNLLVLTKPRTSVLRAQGG